MFDTECKYSRIGIIGIRYYNGATAYIYSV